MRFGEVCESPLAYLLAYLPIEPDAKDMPCLARRLQNDRRALCLNGDAQTNPLARMLADNLNFGPYMAIPCKDKGFEIEGLAGDGRRLLLSLRRAKLRGWSALLEMAVEARGDQLRLVPTYAAPSAPKSFATCRRTYRAATPSGSFCATRLGPIARRASTGLSKPPRRTGPLDAGRCSWITV